MSVQVPYKKQFTLMIVLLLILLVTIEVVLRVYDYFNPQCDIINNDVYKDVEYETKRHLCEIWYNLIWSVDPDTGLYGIEPNQHSSKINFNAHGFRGPEIEKEKPIDTYRIFVVGGSTTVSLRALTDQQTIAGYLQENLDKLNLNKKIQVINAGIPSLTSKGEFRLVNEKIIDFDPDLIIIYDGTNDIFLPLGFELEPKPLRSSFADVYHRYFTFYETPSVINGIIKSSTKSKILFDDSEIGEKVLFWKNNLLEICEIGKQKNFDTLIALQPILGSGNKKLTEHEKSQFEYHDQSKIVPSYQLFADELNDLDLNCTGIIDLQNIFDDIEDSVYFDNAHIGFQYNNIVADELSEKILPIIQN